MFGSNPERKYVELMFEASNCYASWDPLRPVKVGDYGHLMRDYSFAPEGNIFDDGLAEEFDIGLTHNGGDNIRWIDSVRTREQKLSINVGVGHPLTAEGKIKKMFTVSSSYGAILGMLQPRHTSLTLPGQLRDLIYSTAFRHHHVLVSEVYSCRSYARLFVPRQRRAIEVSLDVSGQSHVFHGKADIEWCTSAEGGDFKSLYGDAGGKEVRDVQPVFKLVGRRSRGLVDLYRRRPVTELAPPVWRRVIMRHVLAAGDGEYDEGSDSDDGEIYDGDDDSEDSS